jgi:hypothetical protein
MKLRLRYGHTESGLVRPGKGCGIRGGEDMPPLPRWSGPLAGNPRPRIPAVEAQTPLHRTRQSATPAMESERLPGVRDRQPPHCRIIQIDDVSPMRPVICPGQRALASGSTPITATTGAHCAGDVVTVESTGCSTGSSEYGVAPCLTHCL